MQQRSILLFEQSIKSPTTRLNYKSHMERFLKFAKISDYDALLSMSDDQLQELVENFVNLFYVKFVYCRYEYRGTRYVILSYFGPVNSSYQM